MEKFFLEMLLWMTQSKGIVIGFSISPVKVISGEMAGLLE
jgi:hypothetical protein